MINFKPENLNQLLKVTLISANKSYDAIKDYEFTGEAVAFRVDFEYIDVSLMIVDMLGRSASKFNILPYARITFSSKCIQLMKGILKKCSIRCDNYNFTKLYIKPYFLLIYN